MADIELRVSGPLLGAHFPSEGITIRFAEIETGIYAPVFSSVGTLAAGEANIGEVTVASRTPQAVSATNVNAPAANTAAVVTKVAGGVEVVNVLGGVTWSYDADPTGGSLIIEDGAGNTVFTVYITRGGPGPFVFNPPLRGTAATALIVTLAAGGAGVSGTVSLNTWTE